MATVAPRSDVFTYSDFCALVRDGQKADLIDGEIYMASPDNTDANQLCGWLYCVMNGFVLEKQLGRVYNLSVACRLDDTDAPEPDIFFVSNRRLHQVKRGGLKGPPDLAIEVVSPESVDRDYNKKRKQYEDYGVPEYWIVDEQKKKVLLLRLNNKGKYRDVRPRRGRLESQSLTGFWIDPSWLWQNPLPSFLRPLQQILAESESQE
jgi:Uma2 family endonuclease